jgi:pimeloyl-ACP methyl ester carboxylesterase
VYELRQILIAAIVLIASFSVPATAQSIPKVEPVEVCFTTPPEYVSLMNDMECGYVIVPENRSKPGATMIKIAVMRIKAAKDTDAAPFFMLAGGPGSSIMEPLMLALLQPELLGGILETRDIVFIEQRGTRYSIPHLACPKARQVAWLANQQGLSSDAEEDLANQSAITCIADFKASGVDFAAYNNVENAADVNAVRQAFGYDLISYYGASYGTILGQFVMRDFPDILESVVLDGTDALSDFSWVQNRAVDAQWGVDHLDGLCRQNAECAKAYDIPALLNQAMALFDQGPISATYSDPGESGTVIEFDITRHDLVSTIYGLQADKIGASALPTVLKMLADGGRPVAKEFLAETIGAKLFASREPADGGLAILMHFAMVCSDDPAKSTDELVLDGAGRYAILFGEAVTREYIEVCRIFDVPQLSDEYDINVELDVPVLILSGGLDVKTPTFLSQAVADSLPNATHVIFPSGTHVQLGSINLCAAQITTDFVLNSGGKPGIGCTKDVPPLAFVMPEDVGTND